MGLGRGAWVAGVLAASVVWASAAHATPLKGEIYDRVEVGGRPVRVFYPKQHALIVVLDAEGKAHFLDRETKRKLASTEHMAAGLFDAVLSPDERHLITWSSQDKRLYMVSLETRALDHTLDIGKGVQSVVVVPSRGQLIASSPGSKRLTWIDMETWRTLGRLTIPFPPGRLTHPHPAPVLVFGGGIYSRNTQNAPVGPSLFALPLTPQAPWLEQPIPMRSLDPETHPDGVARTADERWIGGQTQPNLYIRRSQRGVFLTPNGRWVLSTHPSTPVVSISDLSKAVMDRALPVPAGPGMMLFDALGEQVVVLHQRSRHASVVDVHGQMQPRIKHTWKLSGTPWAGSVLDAQGWMVLAMPGRVVRTRGWRYVGRGAQLRLFFDVGHDVPDPDAQDRIALFHPSFGEVRSWRVAPGPVSVDPSPHDATVAIACALDGSVVFMR